MSHLACHASAPQGMKCADCTMGGIPCPECYRVHWKLMYPGDEARMRTDVMDLRMLVRYFLRYRSLVVGKLPLPVNIKALLDLHNFDPDGHHNGADTEPVSPNMQVIEKLLEEVERLKRPVRGWQHTQECSLHNNIRLGNGDMPQCICGDQMRNERLAESISDPLPHT